MSLTIPVAHDFTCPWCWLMVSQIRRLKSEFDIQFEFKGYELWPLELEWPDSPDLPEVKTNRPKTPSRFELAKVAEGIPYPKTKKPHKMRTYNAHQTVEFAKRQGCAWAVIEVLYEAYWLRGENINDPDVIVELTKGLISEEGKLRDAMANKTFAFDIVGFDEPAYATGVYNVPTFFIDGKRLAEQPYEVLRNAILAELKKSKSEKHGVYPHLTFPDAPEGRPYTLINMVTTIDGKILTGDRDEHVMDLGSDIDHASMRQIENACDAVMIGAGSLRSTPGITYPTKLARFVLTESGKLDYKSKFFTESPENAYVITVKNADFTAPNGVHVLRFGKNEIDLEACLEYLRDVLSINHILIEGGSEVNAVFLAEDMIDELFLTMAPKVKLGKKVPTYAGGDPLPRDKVQDYELISCQQAGSEVFLRYRRAVQTTAKEKR